MKTNQSKLFLLSFGCLLLVALGARSQSTTLANWDARAAAIRSSAGAPEKSAAVVRLREMLPGAKVEFEPVVGAPKYVASAEGFLTGPEGKGRTVSVASLAAFAADDPHRVTKAFVREHSELFGHGAEALDQARIIRDDLTQHNGMRTVVWEQQVDGIGVFDGKFVSHTTRNGELINVSSQFLPSPDQAATKGTPERHDLVATPTIEIRKAVALAAQNLGEKLEASVVMPVSETTTNAEKPQKFKAPGLKGETDAKLIWLPMDRSSMRLCWDVTLMSRKLGEMFRILLDARTGEVLIRRCLTSYLSDASYRVYTSDSPSPFSPGWSTPNSTQPPYVSRTLVTLPAMDTNASPQGWIPDNGNETLGNNVDAHTDWNADNTPDLPRPQGSPARVFDFPMDLTAQDPTNYASAAVVQLFYLCNWYHDKLYALGFTEAAGNFQSNNFSRGGLGNDAVQADAQDGSGLNNANFSTPSDGSPGRMQMYIFSGPSPRRDGDFDAEVVFHEHTHGLSWRLVGGGQALGTTQSDGMGEGWSDFYGLCLLSEAGDNVNGNYAAGGYASYEIGGASDTQSYYYGIRRYPYSTDMTKNPLTFKDIDPVQADNCASSAPYHTGMFGTCSTSSASEVHNEGEVWCVTLWEARANLINKYGWAVGNQLILQLATDGMKLTPAQPNFLQARDAIIQADLVDTGGANYRELWAAFAKRGMGFSATSPASTTTTGLVEAFDVPDDLRITPLTGLAGYGQLGGPFTPFCQSYSLTNTGTNTIVWTVTATQPWISLDKTGGTLVPGATNAVNACLNSVANTLAVGSYSASVIFSNSASSTLSIRTFTLDIVPPRALFFSLDADPGWSVQGEWAFGRPAGSGGAPYGYPDPSSGYTGTNVYGINLSGNYATTIGGPFYLTTGPLNLSTFTGTRLQFRRWLNTDYQPYVYATIEISTNGSTWTSLWNNGTATIADSAWTRVSYDISAYADRQSAVYLRWGHRVGASGAFAFSGWNLDDIELLGTPTAPLSLVLPGSALENSGLLVGGGSLLLGTALPTNLVVSLTSSVPGRMTVPPTVTIPAGQTAFTFNLTFIDNSLRDGDQLVTVGASAPGFTNVTASMLVVDDDTPPVIATQPANLTASIAGTAAFNVIANGKAPLSYFWMRNGSLIAGATNSSYSTNNVQLSDSGAQFSCLVSNSYGTVQSSNATLTVVTTPSDWFTELFTSSAFTNVLAFKTFTYAPNGSANFYSVCGVSATAFPTDPTGGTALGLTDDSYMQISLTGGSTVAIYNTRTNLLYIGSNGYLTMNAGDTSLTESYTSHFTLPRVAALFRDLNPGAGGTVSWKQLADRVAVTYQAVPVYGYTTLTNSFQMELFTNGVIRITYLNLNTLDGLVGLSAGAGQPAGFVASDYTTYGICDQLPLTIVTQPASQTVSAGGTATFNISATGTAPLSYFWSRNGSLITGATNATYSTNNVQWSDSGSQLSCLVSNVSGTTNSEVATLTVLAPPLITQQPTNVTVATGGSALFTVVAVGTTPLSYFWWRDGLPIPNATNANYAANNVQTTDSGSQFSCVISNSVGITNSQIVTLTALALPPTITQQPVNQHALAGGSVTFSVTAAGSLPMGYFWLRNGSFLAGATNSTYFTNNLQLTDSGSQFSCLVSNTYGFTNSQLAILTVGAPPLIVQQPTNVTVVTGGTALFHITAVGSDPMNYFWSRNGTLIPNATNSSYSLPNAQLADSGVKFSCLVTNSYGAAPSANATLKVIDTIPNDLCNGAIIITNASYTNTQSTHSATAYGDPVPDCVDGFGHGVWYQFTAPVAGLLLVDTFGSDFDTGLALFIGTCDSLTNVACNDDTGGMTSQVSLPTTAGTTYFILAGGYNSDAGNLVLHLNHLTPPAFDLQPTNLSVVVSSNAIFNPMLSGTLPMSFQWYFNDAPLVNGGRVSGSTNALLVIANVQTNDEGNYQLVASNIIGVTTSSVAVLTPIILPPVIIGQPGNLRIPAGSNATFTVVVAGTAPFSYQWYDGVTPLVDDGRIVGATTASLSISNLTAADNGNYAVMVTNLSGTDISVAASLVVQVMPSFITQPIGRSVPPGLPTTISAIATGSPLPDYQWQFNGTNIPSATASNYTLSAVGSNQIGFYHLIASNEVGVAISADAQLTFGPVAAWGRNVNNECLPPPNLSNVVNVAGCYPASFALRTDGRIISWGSGVGTNVPASVSNVVAVAATGGSGDYALRADGTLVGWSGYAAPVLSNIVAIAAGNYFALALRAEGTVVGWGNTPYSTVPAGLNHVSAIACGYAHSLALRSDGSVIAWGTGLATNVPAGLANVTAIAVGYAHSLALKSNGTVVAWGSGTGTSLPAGLTNVVAISAENLPSSSLSLALRADGMVVAWGDNPYGETIPPSALSNLLSVAVAAAPYHGLALVNDGSPQIVRPPVGLTTYIGRGVTLQASAVGAAPLSYQWRLNGMNVAGATNTSLVIPNVQLTNAGSYQLFVSNAVSTAISLPAPVNIISNNTLVFLGQMTGATNYQGAKIFIGSPGVLGNGPLSYQWYFSTTNKNYIAVVGATNDTLLLDPALAIQSGNYYLAVSNQVAGITNVPVAVRVLFAKAWGYLSTDAPFVMTNATAIAVGNYGQGTLTGEYLALSAAGKISPWGISSSYGETNVAVLSNSTVTAIAAGYADTLVLKSDGTVNALGYTVYGVTNVPATVSSVVAIACGDYHDLALKTDGTVVGWGNNTYSQSTNNSAATNTVAVAAGQYHSLALRADGSVVSWGNNSYGQTTVPAGATNVVAIAAGQTHSLALRANGTVIGWGYNTYGQTTIPVNWTNIVAISAGGSHSTALRSDGTVAVLGYEYVTFATNNLPPDLANVIAIASSGDRDLALFGNRAPAFTVQPWNRTVVYNASAKITLTGKCAGAQPVSYQWRLNGTNLPGATADSLILTNQPSQGAPISLIQPGSYQLVASNAYGVAVSKPAKVTVVIPLADALDTPISSQTGLPLYVWLTTGNAQWFGQTNVTHDGVDAARSGGIGALQETILQTTLATNYSGRATFWWKVSSEQFFDTLEFRLNGAVQSVISGEVDWQLASIPVAAGTNLLQWRYSKDSSFDSGLDSGFVDQFVFVPDAPTITLQPTNRTANAGDTVILRVQAFGAGPLNFQWRRDVTNLIGSFVTGGTNSTVTLSNVGRAQNGIYSAVVSNAGGSTLSSDAALKVFVPQRLGPPVLLPDGSLRFNSTDVNGGLLSPSDLSNFEAQASTNLVNWTTLSNALSLTNGMLQLQDNTRTNYSARYYRLIEH